MNTETKPPYTIPSRRVWITQRIVAIAEAIAACTRHPNRDLEVIATWAQELDALCHDWRPRIAQGWLDRQTAPIETTAPNESIANLTARCRRLEKAGNMLEHRLQHGPTEEHIEGGEDAEKIRLLSNWRAAKATA